MIIAAALFVTVKRPPRSQREQFWGITVYIRWEQSSPAWQERLSEPGAWSPARRRAHWAFSARQKGTKGAALVHLGHCPHTPAAVTQSQPGDSGRLRTGRPVRSRQTHASLPRHGPQDTHSRPANAAGWAPAGLRPWTQSPWHPLASARPSAGLPPWTPSPRARPPGAAASPQPTAAGNGRPPAPPAPGPGSRRPPVGRTRGTIWWPSSLSWL